MKVEDIHLRQERSISDGFVCLYYEEPCIPFFIGKLLGNLLGSKNLGLNVL